MKTPLNITTVSQHEPAVNRSRAMCSLPTREWLVQAGLGAESNPRWESLWAGVSLTVPGSEYSTDTMYDMVESVPTDRVVPFIRPPVESSDSSGVGEERPHGESAGTVHRVDFTRRTDELETRLGRADHQVDSEIHPVRAEESEQNDHMVKVWDGFIASKADVQAPMFPRMGYRSGLRSRPARLSKLSVSLEACGMDRASIQTPIADRLRLDRVLSVLRGMNWSGYTMGVEAYDN